MYGSNFCRATLYPCPSSNAPIEAAANPLPREETTPPVTRMYLIGLPDLLEEGTVVSGVAGMSVIRLLLKHHVSRRGAHAGRRGFEAVSDALEVFGCIDADRIVSCLDHLDPDSVLERAQLFER